MQARDGSPWAAGPSLGPRRAPKATGPPPDEAHFIHNARPTAFDALRNFPLYRLTIDCILPRNRGGRFDTMTIGELSYSRHAELHFTTPVVVCGYRESGTPFQEDTHTLTITPNGSLLPLVTPVRNEQLLLLKNMETDREIVCCVESRGYFANGEAYVKVGFTEPLPGFWGFAFPGEPRDCSSRGNPMHISQ
jgi:hypothetical protein